MHTIDLHKLDITTDIHLLDVGCGEGRHANGMASIVDTDTDAISSEESSIIGVDLDRTRVETALDNFKTHVQPELRNGTHPTFCQGDAFSLPFADESFDIVICSEVLEHLPEYEAAIDELNRVLRPTGTFAVSVPRYGPERICWALSEEYHEVEGGHVRIFRRNDLKNAITSRGLRFREQEYAHALHAPFWWLKCLWWGRETQPWLLERYEQFLENAILTGSRKIDLLEQTLNPIIGKSVVMYFTKPATPP